MDPKILEDLGMTNAEIKVYISLLELGNSSAGPIIERSGLQSSVVHMTLNKLIDKGLISFVKEGKKNHYQASDPRHIIDIIEEKKKNFQKALPELLLKQAHAKERSEVVTFKGIRGIKELMYELLEAGGKEHNTFGSARESLMMGEEWWVNYHKRRSQKGIKANLIFNDSLKFWKAENKYPKSEIRYTSKGFEPLTETIIRNNKIGIILWTEKPIGILITNKVLADSYNKFFQIMWTGAK